MLRMPWVRGLTILATVLVCSSATSIDTIVRPPKFDYRMTTLDNGLKVRPLCLPDEFTDHAKPEKMYAEAVLDAAGIVRTVFATLHREIRAARA